MPAPYLYYNAQRSNFTLLAPQHSPSQHDPHSFAPSSTQLYSHTQAPTRLHHSPNLQTPNIHELALQALWASQDDWKAGSTPLAARASVPARSVIGTRDTGFMRVGTSTVCKSRSVGGRDANNYMESNREAGVMDGYDDGLCQGGGNKSLGIERGDEEPNAFSGQIACVDFHIAFWRRYREEYLMSDRGRRGRLGKSAG